jgi:hypothetical protein
LVLGENVRYLADVLDDDGAISAGTAAQHGLGQAERDQRGIASVLSIRNGLISVFEESRPGSRRQELIDP